MLEFVVKPRSYITKAAIRNLKIPNGAIIGGIVRGKNSYIAMGDLEIREGDHVVVFALPQAIHKLDKLFN